MRTQPFFVLLICFILGIFFQNYFNVKAFAATIFLIISLFGLLAAFFKTYFIQNFRAAILCISFFCLAVFLSNFNSYTSPKISLKNTENLPFLLEKKLNSTSSTRRYEVDFIKNKKYFKGIISIPKDYPEISYDHLYKGNFYVQKVLPPYADFIFDYQTYLARKNIFYTGFLVSDLQETSTIKLNLNARIKNERLKILTKVSKSGLSENSTNFLKGIVLADRTEMSSETINDFQASGLIHLLAISGTHVGIIFFALLFILTRVFPYKYKSYAIILSILMIWLFALFIGLGNSVVRACIMISYYMIYVLLQRKPDLLHTLSLAGLIILINSPQQLFDAGFQLSFAAVLGIYWLSEPIKKLFGRSKFKVVNFLSSVLAVTLAAQISTLPLIIFYFHQISYVSLISNLIVIPLAEIIIIFSLTIAILICFNFHWSLLFKVYDFAIHSLLKLVHFLGSWDFAIIKKVDLTVAEGLILLLICYFLGIFLKKRSYRNLFKISLFILIFLIFRMVITNFKVEKNEVILHQYFKSRIVSVKEGNDILFFLPPKINWEKMEKYVIIPYLTHIRVNHFKITYLPEGTEVIKVKDRKYLVK